MNKQITFAIASDWVAMYVDGKKVVEGHSLHYTHVLDALSIEYTNKDIDDCKSWYSGGTDIVFTDNLEDIYVCFYSERV